MGIDSFSEKDIPASGDGKASEKAHEQFNENLRKAQAAAKKATTSENKFKGYDNTLAAIVQDLLQSTDNDRIVFLIADLIENNVPSDFILSILSIMDERAEIQVSKRIESEGGKYYELALTFESEIKSKIYKWINSIYSCSIIDKEKVLSSLINYSTWECLQSAYLLFFEIIIRILEKEGIEYDRKEQKDFSKSIFDNIIEKLQTEMY